MFNFRIQGTLEATKNIKAQGILILQISYLTVLLFLFNILYYFNCHVHVLIIPKAEISGLMLTPGAFTKIRILHTLKILKLILIINLSHIGGRNDIPIYKDFSICSKLIRCWMKFII